MRSRGLLGFILLLLVTAAPLRANPHEARLPLHDGRVNVAEITALLGHELHLPGASWAGGLNAGEINVNGLRGSLFIQALNASLKDGCRVSVSDNALVFHFDPDQLPHGLDSLKLATRTFVANAAPEATAQQNRLYGLLLPQTIDEARPLVVLVHGLDCDKENWRAFAQLLDGEGYQVAYFTYPSDGPLADSAAMLTQNMSALHETFPSRRVDIIAHSMGSLVARAYVEGDSYAGGVDHLILLGPPNQGSKWARYRMLLEIEEHYHLWKHEPNWSPTWAITDGLGEAGRDLAPQSRFLDELNSHPRQGGVKYTIIAGNQHPATRMLGKVVDATANVIPDATTRWWAVGGAKMGIANLADRINSKCGSSDGPVSVSSTKLDGVEDWVLLPCDHASLYCPCAGCPPAAWETVKDRLQK